MPLFLFELLCLIYGNIDELFTIHFKSSNSVRTFMAAITYHLSYLCPSVWLNDGTKNAFQRKREESLRKLKRLIIARKSNNRGRVSKGLCIRDKNRYLPTCVPVELFGLKPKKNKIFLEYFEVFSTLRFF